MKTIYLLLTAALLTIHSVVYPQRITYSGENVPLKTIFSAIQKQSGYGFFYAKNLLKDAKPVTIKVHNLPVPEVLEQVFKNQPLDYSIENKTILVSKKKTSNSLVNVPLTAIRAPGQTRQQNLSPKDPGPDSLNARQETYPECIAVHDKNPDSTQLSSVKSSSLNPMKAEMNGLNTKEFASSPLSYSQIAISGTDLASKMSGNMALQVKSQSEQSVSAFLKSFGEHRKAFFAEGSFLRTTHLTGNFDMRLKPGRNDGFGVRAGLGTDMYNIIMPLAVNYLLGEKRSSFEAGIGILPTLGGAGFLNLGYRYQPVNEGLMFRANWTKFTSLLNNEPSYYPMLSFSVGYSFYSLGGEPQKTKKSAEGVYSGRKKYLFLEIGGNGVLSANVDMRLKPGQNHGFGLRAGAGFVNNYFTLPLGLNYIIGKKRSGFETGIGITPLIRFADGEQDFNYNDGQTFASIGFVGVGYRLQSYNGFMFRANVSIAYTHSDLLGPWPGISFGYRLNKLK